MKIRSVTSFVKVAENGNINNEQYEVMRAFNRVIKNEFNGSEFELQSLRCATNPFPEYLSGLKLKQAILVIQSIEAELMNIGFDYISIGTAGVEDLEWFSMIPDILAKTENVFATTQLVPKGQSRISIPAIKATADIMRKLSTHDENGFGNLFFAGLAQVPGGIPFLPSAYKSSKEEGLSFALAMESADLAFNAFTSAETLPEAGEKYKKAIEKNAEKLEEIVTAIGVEHGLEFLGFDFTPAPFVILESSAGGALEKLSGASLGEISSVSAAAFLMSVLDHAKFKRSGFNGLMLPVLEDSVLAQRATEGKLLLKDLLLFSTVCGTGLDTVPLPGDITEAQLQAILLDVASLAVRLNKPLTARLMPIPGKKAGQMTSFDFPFFTNSRVMSPNCSGLSGLFSSADFVELKPRA